MRWCEKNTLTFIKLYLSKELLWNPEHEWYRIKFQRENAYSEIVTEFRQITAKCMTIPEVKTKIKNLRCTYTQEVHKIMQKSSPDAIYKPSLIWFHDMDKCLKYIVVEYNIEMKPNARNVTADSLSQEMQEGNSSQARWSSQDTKYSSNIEEEQSSNSIFPVSFRSSHEYNTDTEPCISGVHIKRKLPSSPEYSNLHVKQKKKSLKSHNIA